GEDHPLQPQVRKPGELRGQVIARALELREQRVERRELRAQPRLELLHAPIERLAIAVQPLELRVEPVGARLDQAVALRICLQRSREVLRERADERLDGLGVRGERLVELRAVERDLALNVGRETDVEQSLEAAAGLAVLRAENAREARLQRTQRRVADERPALRAFGAGAAEIADLCHERIVFRHDVVERLAHAFAILLDRSEERRVGKEWWAGR